MFYTLFVLTVGVYLGQEYTLIPRVRIYFNTFLQSLKSSPPPIQQSKPDTTIIDTIKKYL